MIYTSVLRLSLMLSLIIISSGESGIQAIVTVGFALILALRFLVTGVKTTSLFSNLGVYKAPHLPSE